MNEMKLTVKLARAYERDKNFGKQEKELLSLMTELQKARKENMDYIDELETLKLSTL